MKATFNSNPANLDPTANASFAVNAAVASVYSRLIRCAYPSEQQIANIFTCELKPDLISSWDLSADGLTLTLKVQPNVKWQNKAPLNGRAFTADDVVYAINQYKASTVHAAKFTLVSSVTAVDASTVQVKFSRVFVPFIPSALADSKTMIVPKEVKDQDGDFKKTAIGTGAFMLKEFVSGQRIVFEKNPNYWRTGLPYLDGYEVSIVLDSALAQAAYRTKQIHYLAGAQPTNNSDLGRLFRDRPDSVVAEQEPDLGTFFVAMRLDKAPFNDVNVRRALSLGIDANAIINGIFEGKASMLPPYPWSYVYDKQPTLQEFSQYAVYNPDQAKALLTQALGANYNLQFTLGYFPYSVAIIQFVQVIQSQWKKIDVNITLPTSDYAAFITQYATGTYESAVVGFAQTETDVDGYTYAQMYSTSARNSIKLKNPDIDKLLDAQRSDVDPAKRRADIQGLWNIEKDQVYRIIIPEPVRPFLYDPKLHNLIVSQRAGWPHFGAQQAEVLWLSP